MHGYLKTKFQESHLFLLTKLQNNVFDDYFSVFYLINSVFYLMIFKKKITSSTKENIKKLMKFSKENQNK